MSANGVKRDGWQGNLAEELWVHAQASEKEVCGACDINATTLREWRRHFGWDEQRAAAAKRFGGLYALVQNMAAAIGDELKDAPPSDTGAIGALREELNGLLQTAERIRKLNRDIDYKRMALRYSRELTTHLKAKDPEALKALMPHLKAFTIEIARG